MRNTLLLVDGSSYIYRAFYALPDIRNIDNFPVGALYGTINMLRKLYKNYQATYIACIFDAKGKTFRNILYPAYKATRKKMPYNLILQIKLIHTAVRAIGWPILIMKGVEADDVIGTLAKQAIIKYNLKVIISTNDKDMAQLVNNKIILINNNKIYDRTAVISKFGVSPEKIVDYFSLIGDVSDNLPGVKKIGPKTAIKLLNQYHSLEGIIKNSNKIKGVIGENLRFSLNWLPKIKKLLTIKTDCNLTENIVSIPESLIIQPKDEKLLIKLLNQYKLKEKFLY
ncbi:DNA polymerase I [Candidatus Profftella armatura (Diaphorina cf. continua)]|uniref:DNA polymerase I n=1 Tax=Candidatus Profftella armatura (Diaphorina cf. continua) TaxID=2661583 RepID=A0A7R7AB28_9PROT|nr:5'-3' exonuclease H3TH domain-containing protein [Candidatus Profftella armatura (Diaphorina cf. continua)]BCG49670.1 DNA polymerase I [Candidatus Profftella armatura (Diaphorina cf. continua)]